MELVEVEMSKLGIKKEALEKIRENWGVEELKEYILESLFPSSKDVLFGRRIGPGGWWTAFALPAGCPAHRVRCGRRARRFGGRRVPRSADERTPGFDSSGGQEFHEAHGNGEVVQQQQRLRLHQARQRRGRVRPLLRPPGRGIPIPG